MSPYGRSGSPFGSYRDAGGTAGGNASAGGRLKWVPHMMSTLGRAGRIVEIDRSQKDDPLLLLEFYDPESLRLSRWWYTLKALCSPSALTLDVSEGDMVDADDDDNGDDGNINNDDDDGDDDNIADAAADDTESEQKISQEPARNEQEESASASQQQPLSNSFDEGGAGISTEIALGRMYAQRLLLESWSLRRERVDPFETMNPNARAKERENIIMDETFYTLAVHDCFGPLHATAQRASSGAYHSSIGINSGVDAVLACGFESPDSPHGGGTLDVLLEALPCAFERGFVLDALSLAAITMRNTATTIKMSSSDITLNQEIKVGCEATFGSSTVASAERWNDRRTTKQKTGPCSMLIHFGCDNTIPNNVSLCIYGSARCSEATRLRRCRSTAASNASDPVWTSSQSAFVRFEGRAQRGSDNRNGGGGRGGPGRSGRGGGGADESDGTSDFGASLDVQVCMVPCEFWFACWAVERLLDSLDDGGAAADAVDAAASKSSDPEPISPGWQKVQVEAFLVALLRFATADGVPPACRHIAHRLLVRLLRARVALLGGGEVGDADATSKVARYRFLLEQECQQLVVHECMSGVKVTSRMRSLGALALLEENEVDQLNVSATESFEIMDDGTGDYSYLDDELDDDEPADLEAETEDTPCLPEESDNVDEATSALATTQQALDDMPETNYGIYAQSLVELVSVLKWAGVGEPDEPDKQAEQKAPPSSGSDGENPGTSAEIPVDQYDGPPVDSNGNEMTISCYAGGGYANGWVCDVCRTHYAVGTARWFSQACGADICFDCRRAPPEYTAANAPPKDLAKHAVAGMAQAMQVLYGSSCAADTSAKTEIFVPEWFVRAALEKRIDSAIRADPHEIRATRQRLTRLSRWKKKKAEKEAESKHKAEQKFQTPNASTKPGSSSKEAAPGTPTTASASASAPASGPGGDRGGAANTSNTNSSSSINMSDFQRGLALSLTASTPSGRATGAHVDEAEDVEGEDDEEEDMANNSGPYSFSFEDDASAESPSSPAAGDAPSSSSASAASSSPAFVTPDLQRRLEGSNGAQPTGDSHVRDSSSDSDDGIPLSGQRASGSIQNAFSALSFSEDEGGDSAAASRSGTPRDESAPASGPGPASAAPVVSSSVLAASAEQASQAATLSMAGNDNAEAKDQPDEAPQENAVAFYDAEAEAGAAAAAVAAVAAAVTAEAAAGGSPPVFDPSDYGMDDDMDEEFFLQQALALSMQQDNSSSSGSSSSSSGGAGGVGDGAGSDSLPSSSEASESSAAPTSAQSDGQKQEEEQQEAPSSALEAAPAGAQAAPASSGHTSLHEQQQDVKDQAGSKIEDDSKQETKGSDDQKEADPAAPTQTPAPAAAGHRTRRTLAERLQPVLPVSGSDDAPAISPGDLVTRISSLWSRRDDEILIAWLAEMGDSGLIANNASASDLRPFSLPLPPNVAPASSDTSRAGLEDCSARYEDLSRRLGGPGVTFSPLEIRLRVCVLQELNHSLRLVLPFVGLSECGWEREIAERKRRALIMASATGSDTTPSSSSSSSIGSQLSALRALLFYDVKYDMWCSSMVYTVANPATVLEGVTNGVGGHSIAISSDPSADARPHVTIDRVAAATLWETHKRLTSGAASGGGGVVETAASSASEEGEGGESKSTAAGGRFSSSSSSSSSSSTSRSNNNKNHSNSSAELATLGIDSTLFEQARSQLNNAACWQLRSLPPTDKVLTHMAFEVELKGEMSDGGPGGPYREFFASVAQELQASLGGLALLIPAPVYAKSVVGAGSAAAAGATNAVAAAAAGGGAGHGTERCFVLNPAASSPGHLRQFEFLGILIGCALRTHVLMPLELPQLVWKYLVGLTSTRADIKEVDGGAAASLLSAVEACTTPAEFDTLVHDTLAHDRPAPGATDQSLPTSTGSPLRGARQQSDTSEPEEDNMSSNVPTGLPWTCARSDGFVAALSPPGGNGGAAAPRGVSFAERLEFVRQYEECLLEESSQQAQALARGLQRVVPAGLLRLFTPTEFQRMVCGRPTIDLVLLKRHTVLHDGIAADAPFIASFWRVLEGFTQEELKRFVQFSYAQRRLPSSDEDWRLSRTANMRIMPAKLPKKKDSGGRNSGRGG